MWIVYIVCGLLMIAAQVCGWPQSMDAFYQTGPARGIARRLDLLYRLGATAIGSDLALLGLSQRFVPLWSGWIAAALLMLLAAFLAGYCWLAYRRGRAR